MGMDKKQAILQKIKEYDTIMLFRHIRPDGDAKGSTKGLQAILKATWPEKQVYLINDDHSDYLAFMGDDEADVADEVYEKALGIVLDTATLDRIANKKYSLCKELIKIDHHIEVEPYGDLSWVEEERSSACEMIAAFYDAFRDELKLDKTAATYIYAGMVTDSGRFRFRSVSGETMRLAGILLDTGIDTDTLYAHLCLKDFDSLKFQAYVYKKMKMTENGVVYLHVDRAMQKKFNLTSETAGTAVSFMDSIKGSLIWLAFIDNADGTTRVRLRSRFVTINEIAEKYHGGGHACASGATVHNKKEMKALIAEADAHLKQYKETNEGWL